VAERINDRGRMGASGSEVGVIKLDDGKEYFFKEVTKEVYKKYKMCELHEIGVKVINYNENTKVMTM
jgi:hypothetical protein